MLASTTPSSTRPNGILIINGCLPPPFGGIAKYLAATLPLLVSRGYRICAAMPRDYGSGDYQEFRDQGIEILLPRGKRAGKLFTTLGLIIRYFPWILKRCLLHRLPFKEAILLLHSWLPECDEFLEKNSEAFDMIHVYDAPWAQGWIGLILARKHKKRLLITTFGEIVPHSDPIRLIDDLSYRYRSFCTEVIQSCNAISSPTLYCASKLEFIGVPKEKVQLTYHVSGTAAFQKSTADCFEEKYPALKDKRIVLFVGQIQQRKGPHVLLEAAAEVLQKDRETHYVFAGPDCGMLSSLKERAKVLRIEASCLFTGALPEYELASLYARADIFVFPTISQIECLGLTFVQAMFAGCPVIASRISGVPEVIRHGNNGLLFEPGDARELSTQLLRLLSDESTRSRLSQQAKLDALAQFPEPKIMDQITAFYERA